MTEDDLKGGVIDCARTLGYLVAHFRPAKTEHGWRTPVEGDGKGFPDLVLTGRGRVIFAELKGDKGKLSDEQIVWISALTAAGAETFIWKPADWTSGAIEKALRS